MSLHVHDREPVKTSSLGTSIPGHSTPSPLPVPALVSHVTGQDVGLPSLLESSSDKENSVPGSQQSSQVVSKLIPVIEEEHLDISRESGHVMAHRVQDKMVHLILGQQCRSKAHPSCRDHRFHPFPQLGDGGDGFPFSHRGRGEQNIGGGDRERFQRTRCLREGRDGDVRVVKPAYSLIL